MPWYGFTHQGVQDRPDPTSSVATGQIFWYPSTGYYDSVTSSVVAGTPPGYLRCDGSNAVIATYQDLYDFFVAAGVFFGAAPAGEFKLPNFSSRFPVGLDTSNVAVDVIGETGGLAAHSHTVATNHTHSTVSHVHTLSNHRHSYGDHRHALPAHTHGDGLLSGDGTGAGANPLYADNSAPYDFYVTKVGHSHTASGTSGGINTGLNSEFPSRNLTEQVTGSLPSTSSTTDATTGNPSTTTTLSSTGSDSIPPYYSTYYIIKV